jgi:hypothetical protein
MFCPTCGREEAQERKFCIACGTNLERVTKALSPSGERTLVRIDRAFDKIMAHYAGLFFGNALNQAAERRTANSWKIWGESFLSLLGNFILFWPMLFVALPLRLLVLLFSTPSRLLAERSNRNETAELSVPRWSAETIVPSVTDPATMKMIDQPDVRRREARH